MIRLNLNEAVMPLEVGDIIVGINEDMVRIMQLIILLIILLVFGVLPIVLLVKGIRKKKRTMTIIGTVWIAIYGMAVLTVVFFIVDNLRREVVYDHFAGISSGEYIRIIDEGTSSQGINVGYYLLDDGVIDKETEVDVTKNFFVATEHKTGYTFKGLKPGETYIFWYTISCGDITGTCIYHIIVDENLNITIADDSEYYSLSYMDSNEKYAEILVRARDIYGFDGKTLSERYQEYVNEDLSAK